MSWKYDLGPIFSPRAIAMIGPSDQPGSWQNHLYNNIRRGGFTGTVYPVHPKRDVVWGLPCHKSIEFVDDEVDLAILIIPNHQIEPTLRQCAQKKVKAAIVLSSGFAEVAGEEGTRLQQKITDIAEQEQIRLIGPNCLGALSCLGGLVGYAGKVPSPLIPGGFGVVAQSGALTSGFMVAAHTRGLGMSYLFSSGNEAVLEASDYFRFMIADSQTKVIGAFIEGFKNPRKFLEVCDLALTHGKPIIVLKVGRTEKSVSTAKAHTGAVAGSDIVQDAIFSEKGIIRVNTIDEMIDTAQILSQRRPVRSGNLTVMATSGGVCDLVGDYCQELNINLPDLSPSVSTEIRQILPPFGIVDNPLDATGQARQDPQISCRIIDVLLAEDETDILLFGIASLASLADPNFQKILQYLAQKGKEVGKNVGVLGMITESFTPEVLEYSRKNPIAILTGGYCGLLAVRHLIEYTRSVECIKRSKKPSYTPDPRIQAILRDVRERSLSKSAGRKLLETLGIPILDASLKTKSTEGSIVVQGKQRTGMELIVSALADRQFGPVIVLKMGGMWADVCNKVSTRVAPVNCTDALEMIRYVAGEKIFKGIYSNSAFDIDALSEAIVRTSELSLQFGEQLNAIVMDPLVILQNGGGVAIADYYIDLK